jgi:hypothetical protein
MKNIPTKTFFIIAVIGYLFGVFTSSPIAPIIWVPSLIIGLVKVFSKKNIK